MDKESWRIQGMVIAKDKVKATLEGVVYDDCTKYITATKYYSGDNLYTYPEAFRDNNVTLPTNGVDFNLDIYITDPLYNSSNQIDSMDIVAFDKEFDNYNMDTQDLGGTPTPFERSLLYRNEYFLSQPKDDRLTYYWKFTRTIKYSLVNDLLSYFGKPTYIKQPYIDTNMQIVPYTATSYNTSDNPIEIINRNGTFYATLQFTPNSNPIVKIETEQRNKTVLNLLGILGGIWSAMAAFYVFLFGLGLISPWGFVHKSRPFKDQYKKNLLMTTMDLQFDKLDEIEKYSTEKYENSSSQKRLDDLEKQVEHLKKLNQFYIECIIDTSFLNSIKTDSLPLLDTE
ncbi:30098_t:CDS:10 [Gigaspora margarita]|uniref:30098_t:CDS:1 n=1 Tax=Gigaspora margarita TaxID=4874 RepID=A0ABN7U8B1_GIGMA|nr:30098_t:CDS:10 [Gigaspora margarita]